MKYDLSVIVPGIRNENWDTLYDHMHYACRKYSFEMIFVGPKPLTSKLQNLNHIKYIKDFGTPTRALHLGTMLAEGDYLTWLSDDAHLFNHSLDLALLAFTAQNSEKDIMGIRYTEGQGFSGQEFQPSYWVAGTHPDLCAPGVNREWKTSGVLLLANSRYRELGGLDCSFEHINMNVHDLAFRVQKEGYKIHMSPLQVMNCDWEPWRNAENSPVIAAFFENDLPRFKEIYKDDSRPVRIDINNWKQTSTIWHRRKY